MTAEQMEELATLYRAQMPGTANWFRVIDHVVGVLLSLEIERAKKGEVVE